MMLLNIMRKNSGGNLLMWLLLSREVGVTIREICTREKSRKNKSLLLSRIDVTTA